MNTAIFETTKDYVEQYPLNSLNWSAFLSKASQEEFLNSQEGFFYAVKAFPQMLAKLASLIEDSESRMLVIENLWEEHGQGNEKLFHTNSYYQYLQSLGLKKDIKEIQHNPWIEDWINLSLSKNYTATQYSAYLAGIEYIYARISKIISDRIQVFTLYYEQTHYAKHSVLDYAHAAELLEVAIKCQQEESDEEIFNIFKESIDDFLNMFEKMVILTEQDAQEFAKEKVAFYYGREDTTIEKNVVEQFAAENINKKPKVLMVCSGGENSIELLTMNKAVDIVALDINLHQIAVAKSKIDDIFNQNNVSLDKIIYNEGKFEKLFQVLAKSFNDKDFWEITNEQTRGLEKLKYVCDNLFSNKVLEIIFTEEATKYSKQSFPEHFYNVFAAQIKYYYEENIQYSNIGSVLGKTKPINYQGEINKNSSIDYFNGTFEQHFKNDNTKYDIIDVSNISDWMSKEKTIQTIKLVHSHLNKGGYLIGRKLLGDYNWIELISNDCGLNMDIEEVKDQTSFYTQTVIAQKVR
jgi:pyrroloquinoline quinone (PQQ) biosynthesis protein C